MACVGFSGGEKGGRVPKWAWLELGNLGTGFLGSRFIRMLSLSVPLLQM